MQLQTIVEGKISIKDAAVHFDVSCDVCVIGLGTAGAIAAISAAESGVSVIGVDRTPYLGGMGTAACVWDYFYGTQGGMVMSVNEECYRRIHEKKYVSAGGREIRDEALPGVVKDMVLRERALNAGCGLFPECSVIGVFLESNCVCGAQIFDGKELINIGCKVLIDGTDGIVCKLAGCEFLSGRPGDGHTMRFSHMVGALEENRARGNWGLSGFPEVDSAEEWSQMILESAPPYSGKRLLCEAVILGTREVVNVRTDEVYTLSDAAAGKKVSEPLFYGFSAVDNVNDDVENESSILQDWKFICKMGRFGISVGISKGTMIPFGKEGIMIVSRAKGLGHELSSCIRMKYDLEKGGEAAGKIAAMACKKGCSVREVAYEALQPVLLESGCLNPFHDIGICDLNEPYLDGKNGRLWRKVTLPQTPSDYKKRLASREPGPALWTLRNHCTEELRSSLKEWMQGDDRLLAENSAIALGLLSDTSAIPMLRDILSRPPVGYYYCVEKVKNTLGWLMESPFCNYSKALLLLGRFRDTFIIPKLEEIIADEGKTAAGEMKADERFPGCEVMEKRIYIFRPRGTA